MEPEIDQGIYQGMTIKLKRVYEQPDTKDGERVLVDRLWPRGLTKEKARVDLWLKEIAPSTELRRWFGHDPAKWTEVKRRYRAELTGNNEQVARLQDEMEKRPPVTRRSAPTDEQHESGVAL